MANRLWGLASHPNEGRRKALLAGTGLYTIALVAFGGSALAGNLLPTQGSTNLASGINGSVATKVLVGSAVTAGSANYTSNSMPAGSTATLTLTAARTLIDWDTYQVGTGNTLTYNFTQSASDTVINRVLTGNITIQAGGAVVGQYAGATNGNIWFLAPNGVFINGTVSASGVVASNNTGLSDATLLNPATTPIALLTDGAAVKALIDISGTVTATNATLDATGAIMLGDTAGNALDGQIDAGAGGAVGLYATGTITESAGSVITAATFTGSSIGGANLGAAGNQIGAINSFSNTTAGDIVIDNGTDISVSGLSNDSGSITLSTTGSITQTGAPIASAVDITLTATTSLDEAASPFVGRDYTVTAATFGGLALSPTFSPGGADFTIHGTGPLTLANDVTAPRDLTVTSVGLLDTSGATMTATTGSLSLTGGNGLDVGPTVATSGPTTLTALAGDIVISGEIDAPAMVLTTTASAGSISETGSAGAIVAGTLTGASMNGTTLASPANAVGTLAGFMNSGSGPIELIDGVALDITGTVNDVGGDVAILLPTAGSVTGTGDLQAGGDVAVMSAQGGIALASASAGDDVVLRAPNGAVVVSGALTSGTGADTGEAGAGDVLATASPLTLFGVSGYDTTVHPLTGGGMVDVSAQTVSVGGATTAGLAGMTATDNVWVMATGADAGPTAALTLTGPVSATQDVALDASGAGGSVAVTGALLAGRDVAIRAVTGTLTLASASAGDDVLLRAGGNVTATGAITSGTGTDAAGAADDLLASSASVPMTAFGTTYTTLAGSSPVEIRSGGTISLTTVTTHDGGDIRLQTTGTPQGAIDFTSLNAAGDIVIDGGSVGDGTPSIISPRDVVVSGGVLDLGFVSAGDDILLRSTGSVTTGQLTSGTVGESSGAADAFLANNPGRAMTVFGHTYQTVADGSQIDVVASGGDVTVGGSTLAGSDARFQSLTGAVHTAAVTAGRDVVIDAVTLVDDGATGSNPLSAGRDVAVNAASGGVTLTSAGAADDVVLRAGGSVMTGTLTSGTGADAVGAGDVLAGVSPMTVFGTGSGHAFGDLTGGQAIDVVAGVGAAAGSTASVVVTGQATATGAGSDARFQAPGAIGVAGVSAGRDVLLDGALANGGSAATVSASGLLFGGRDVAVRSGLGAVDLASAEAGDDLVIRAATSVTVTGSLTTDGAQTSDATAAGHLVFDPAPTMLNGAFSLGRWLAHRRGDPRVDHGRGLLPRLDRRALPGGRLDSVGRRDGGPGHPGGRGPVGHDRDAAGGPGHRGAIDDARDHHADGDGERRRRAAGDDRAGDDRGAEHGDVGQRRHLDR